MNPFRNEIFIRGGCFSETVQKLVLNLLRGSPETDNFFYEFSVDQYESCLSLFPLGGDNIILVNSLTVAYVDLMQTLEKW